jgi:DNA-binding response OmpR family regulator
MYAGDAISAIALARRHEPDLVILDVGLPAGDAYLIMQRFRGMAALSVTPVIVISGRERVEQEGRAAAAGAVAYFQKPLDVDLLLATVEQSLALRAPV